MKSILRSIAAALWFIVLFQYVECSNSYNKPDGTYLKPYHFKEIK